MSSSVAHCEAFGDCFHITSAHSSDLESVSAGDNISSVANDSCSAGIIDGLIFVMVLEYKVSIDTHA